MLSKKGVIQLKQLHKEECGKELSDSETLEMGNNLLNLFSVLLKPLSRDELEEFKKIKSCQQKKK